MRKKKLAVRLVDLEARYQVHREASRKRIFVLEKQLAALGQSHHALHGRATRLEDAVVELIERANALELQAKETRELLQKVRMDNGAIIEMMSVMNGQIKIQGAAAHT